ncbi:MAG: type I DNA topoisomerase [Lachnospiraceae bacterium]|nr:type I DNA topoisomerase [Lachnospiraceae bacterium]
MAKYLVIVESPAKAKTIQKFLGKDYTVLASNGHVRDLPKSSLGVDTESDYEPHYITIRGKGEVLSELRKEVKKAKKVYLATDPDREGEAISWHLMQVLKLNEKDTRRITFNEITKNAVTSSLAGARSINMNLVDAQQARRILDRMVGYEISPILWAKVKRGLSAGRVQSVTLRIIADRENEIAAFACREYWTIEGRFYDGVHKEPITAVYCPEGKKKELASKEEADQVIAGAAKSKFTVTDSKLSVRKQKAPLPYTTSTLQQDASKKLNFSTQKTMRVAQQLYEGVTVKGHGSIGLITYLRTDSTRISEEAAKNAAAFIKERYGEEFLGEERAESSNGKKIQDAHEAIRPTYIDITPASVKDQLTNEQFRLYQLVWKRFMASRMSDCVTNVTTLTISDGTHEFTASASKCTFEGFRSVYTESADEKETEKSARYLPEKGATFVKQEVEGEQHFTQPPAHYTEASLVRTMEELGIGRPSTYAPTITTLLTRHYIAKDGKNLFVTELGEAVNEMMKSAFTSIVAVDFTANMELLLDGVEDGTVNWKTVISNFYPDLKSAVDVAEKELSSVQIQDEVSDQPCEVCGRMLVIKYGPHGKFLACPGFPECRFTKTYTEKTGIPCPKCGNELVIRRTKRGKRYFGCTGYPECDYMSWQAPKSAANEENAEEKENVQ